jgi:hypothetical protein
MSAYLQLTITDHAISPLDKVTRTFWYRLPCDWVTGGALAQGRRDLLLDSLYGPGWREGHYLILEIQERILSQREVRAKPWLSDRAGFYVCAAGASPREVIPAEL